MNSQFKRSWGVLGLLVLVALLAAVPGRAWSAPRSQDDTLPRVRTTTPRSGETLPINEAIKIFFTQPMDRPSTEAAFSVTPNVPGEFSWTDDNLIMTFRPSENYQRSSTYTFSLGTGATSADGTPLAEPFTLTLDTGILATNPDYLLIGYLAMALLLGGMILWMAWRFRAQVREGLRVEQMAAEESADHVASAVGALEEDARPDQATPGVSGMEAPLAPRERRLPD